MLFDSANPDGVKLANGEVHPLAEGALRLHRQGLELARDVHAHGGGVVIEHPVNHGADSMWPIINSKRTSFHVALELEHVESVDLRSAIRKADSVLPAFARAGQRGDTLKRVARRGGCRLLFRLGVQHIVRCRERTSRISNCARTKRTGGNRRAGEQAGLGPTARGAGAAPLTYGQARYACCSRCAHPGPVLQLEANVIPRRA